MANGGTSSTCGHDHSEEIKEAHKRAAEAVVTASSADRASLNEHTSTTVASARETWPNVADEDLVGFFMSQATLIERLSRMDVASLVTVLDAVFTTCTLAAAVLAGAYDLDDTNAPKLAAEDIISEARAAAAKRLEDLNANTGMFL